jgi:N-acylglucosamine-6-phosphate 2-epimerase
MSEIISQLRNGLIVSCQSETGEYFGTPESIAAFAKSAQLGGAAAIRAEGVDNIKAIRRELEIPIIGIIEGQFSNNWVCITPDFGDVEKILEAGANLVALDVTNRKRPNGLDGIEFFDEVRSKFDVPLIADIATFEEGICAVELGADMVASTLSGFTEYTENNSGDKPDLDLVERLFRAVKIPIIAEGRVWTPDQAKEALHRGAYAVVVGAAITRPKMITKKFVDIMSSKIY